MRKIAAIAALSASAFGLSAGASFADYTLTILHINDWHSRIESNNKFESTCSAEEEGKGECIGGAARLVTAIAAERKKLEGQNVLLLNGGDNFQGSLFYTTYKGAAEAEFLNQMKFDAMTVGNHEFDDGEDALAPFLDEIKFPVLSANVKASAASKVGDRIKPSLVLDVGGQKIGIVGAVTTDTPEIASPGPNIAIEDDIATITAEVEKLKGAGRQQDHRAHPCRLSPRQGDDRQDPGRRRGGRRPFAFAAVEHRRQGRGPVSDDDRQPGRLQGAGDAGGVLFEISRRVHRDLRRQRRRQGGQGRSDLPRQVDRAGRRRCSRASRNSARRSRN